MGKNQLPIWKARHNKFIYRNSCLEMWREMNVSRNARDPVHPHPLPDGATVEGLIVHRENNRLVFCVHFDCFNSYCCGSASLCNWTHGSLVE